MPFRPNLIILAGCNGAGKTTSAPSILKGTLRVAKFVNADVIARGLSGFDPTAAATHAGRIMLRRINELAAARETFAFESTLAGRSLATWLPQRIADGYAVHIVFLWLPSPEIAIARVAGRVRRGGHDIPETTIRRRFQRGLHNFFALYQPLATTWRVYDNQGARPRLVARGERQATTLVRDLATWKEVRALAGLG